MNDFGFDPKLVWKRTLTAVIALTFGFVLFSPGCGKQPAPAADAACDSGSCELPMLVLPTVTTTIVADDNWKFAITGEDWHNLNPPSPSIKAINISREKGALVIFLKENIGDDTFPEYVIGSVREFVASGHLVNAVKQVDINNSHFAEVQVNTDDSVIWIWLTTKNGFGYGFSCGGPFNPDAGSALHDFCETTASSLEID